MVTIITTYRPLPSGTAAAGGRVDYPRYATYIMYRAAAALLALCLIGLPARAAGQTSPSADVPGDTRIYEVDTGASHLKIFIGRAGLLSGMGHNHVVVNRAIEGTVSIAREPGQSRARLVVPVEAFSVDEAGEMRAAGYESSPSASDKGATRENMLGPAVLEADKYPRVVAVIGIEELHGTQGVFSVTLDFKGMRIGLSLPATISLSDQSLVADAGFSLEHGELGLEPFATLGGILRVARTLEFQLRLVATSRR